MNLFYLDENLALAASYHVDKHVVKMPLEAWQVCSTAIQVRGEAGYLDYKLLLGTPTHINHPLVKWACEDVKHIAFVAAYGMCVAAEYEYRYDNQHALAHKLRFIYDYVCDGESSPGGIPLCMPDEYKIINPVTSYRNYYSNAKAHLHKWTSRPIPSWIATMRRVST